MLGSAQLRRRPQPYSPVGSGCHLPPPGGSDPASDLRQPGLMPWTESPSPRMGSSHTGTSHENQSSRTGRWARDRPVLEGQPWKAPAFLPSWCEGPANGSHCHLGRGRGAGWRARWQPLPLATWKVAQSFSPVGKKPPLPTHPFPCVSAGLLLEHFNY